MKYEVLSDDWILIVYITCEVHVDVNHGLRKSAEFHIFESIHQSAAKLLNAISMELSGEPGAYLPLQLSSWIVVMKTNI